MTSIGKSLSCWYRNLKIRSKILLILAGSMALFWLIGLLTMRLTYHVYCSVLYNQAYSAMSMTTMNIEHDLQNIDNISYEMVADSNIQQYVADIKDSPDAYRRASSLTSLLGQLSTYTLQHSFITSVNYIDTQGTPNTIGVMNTLLQEPAVSIAQTRAAQAQGSGVFLEVPGKVNHLYLARQIRAVPNLRLDDMGTIVIECDIQNIVKTYLDAGHNLTTGLIITDGTNMVYRSSLLPAAITGDEKETSGYSLRNIGHKKYFTVSKQSETFGWHYIYAIPYDSIFQKVAEIQSLELLVFLLAFVAVLLLGRRLAISMTRPLEKLASAICLVETGSFQIPPANPRDTERRDEIGMLAHDFRLMVRKINDLITENYVKQLTIKDTQMKALQAQINPHFLYNTLESINWMAKLNQQPEISRMAESLGYLLRGALKMEGNVITVDRELQLLKSYITIEAIRYEDRLDFHLVVENRLRTCQMPPFTLQPLVENSIAYGLEKRTGSCRIEVRFFDDPEKLWITVEDNGPGISPERMEQIRQDSYVPKGFGIGLKNIRDRYRLIYGDAAGITISSPGTGTRVTLWLPKRTEDRKEEAPHV